MTELAETLSRVSTAAYAASSGAAGGFGTDEGDAVFNTGPSNGDGPEAGAGDETVEGEFKEV